MNVAKQALKQLKMTIQVMMHMLVELVHGKSNVRPSDSEIL